MHVIKHFLTGWAGSLPTSLKIRDRGLAAAASISPDLDGLVMIGDLIEYRTLGSCEFSATCHHVTCHNPRYEISA